MSSSLCEYGVYFSYLTVRLSLVLRSPLDCCCGYILSVEFNLTLLTTGKHYLINFLVGSEIPLMKRSFLWVHPLLS